jgi:hypothetical protein
MKYRSSSRCRGTSMDLASAEGHHARHDIIQVDRRLLAYARP